MNDSNFTAITSPSDILKDYLIFESEVSVIKSIYKEVGIHLMKLKIDISGVDFADSDIVDFYDSKTIFFEPTNQLPETLSFKIWEAYT